MGNRSKSKERSSERVSRTSYSIRKSITDDTLTHPLTEIDRYLRAVESQLHSAEALLGVILSIPDPAVRQQLNQLHADPFAESVLTRVRNGTFGPARFAIEGGYGALEGIEDVYASEDKEGGDSVSYVELKVLRLRWY